MKRREFLQKSLLLGAAGLMTPAARLYGAVSTGYEGPLLVVLQADGGWDVTAFCDPKVNQTGEPEITSWSRNNDIQTAGNINYAPFANNAPFFEKYYRDMLVINGVDAQTNSHTTGVLHNWSGRNAEGYPTLTALFAAHKAPDQPLSYINFGGFGQTANLIRFSRLDDVNALRNLLQPERGWGDTFVRKTSDMDRIREYRRIKLSSLVEEDNLMHRIRLNAEAYDAAIESKSSLTEFFPYLPSDDEILDRETVNNQVDSDLRRQIQLTISAFTAGVSSGADLFIGGYDTHTNHDSLHEPLLAYTTDAIDMLWTSAEAAGIADRLTVLVGSDFSRTPWYNADNGKDHWPIGSYVVMQKGASWGNRQVGLTDEQQNAYNINPATLERDDANGTIIYPKHVHKAMRRLLGLEGSPAETGLAFTATEDFSFFG